MITSQAEVGSRRIARDRLRPDCGSTATVTCNPTTIFSIPLPLLARIKLVIDVGCRRPGEKRKKVVVLSELQRAIIYTTTMSKQVT